MTTTLAGCLHDSNLGMCVVYKCLQPHSTWTGTLLSKIITLQLPQPYKNIQPMAAEILCHLIKSTS